MLGKNIISTLMKNLGIKQGDMMDALNKNFGLKISQASLSERLHTRKTSNLTIANLNTMLRVLGYKVVVMPIGMKTPDTTYEVTDGLEPAEAEEK